MTTKNSNNLTASLNNPFAESKEREFRVPGQVASAPGLYEEALKSAGIYSSGRSRPPVSKTYSASTRRTA
jgi:hypothetical protein